jgi:hypothetical protein
MWILWFKCHESSNSLFNNNMERDINKVATRVLAACVNYPTNTPAKTIVRKTPVFMDSARPSNECKYIV